MAVKQNQTAETRYRKCFPLVSIILCILLTLLSAISTVAETWFSGNFINALTQGQLTSIALVDFILPIFLMVFIEYLSQSINTYTIARAAEDTLYNLRRTLYEDLLHIEYQELERTNTGELLSVIQGDLEKIKEFIYEMITQTGSFVMAVISVFVCLLISWKLTILCALCIPVILLIGRFSTRKVDKKTEAVRNETGKTNHVLLDILSGINEIKIFSLRDMMLHKYRGTLKRVYQAWREAGKSVASSVFVSQIASGLPVLAILCGGIYYIFLGEITIGDFFVFSFIFSNITNLSAIVNLSITQKEYNASRNRILRWMSMPDETETKGTSEWVLSNNGETENAIVFDDVTFGYAGRENLFHDFHFTMPVGRCFAIIGKSGAGKSTLIQLLTGLYQPLSGEIMLNDISTTYKRTVRKQVALVPQDNFLFPMSIRENLLIVNPDLKQIELEEACRAADILERIQTLPQGFDTQIGEMGGNLSGGERQRICIARALLSRAPILVFDEPTAALDAGAEAAVMQSIQKLMDTHTVLLFSHRHTTVLYADEIYYLNQGELQCLGTAKELEQNPEWFQTIFEQDDRAYD